MGAASDSVLNAWDEACSQCGLALGSNTRLGSWIQELQQEQPWRIARTQLLNYKAVKILAALSKSEEPIDIPTISKLTSIPQDEVLDYEGHLGEGLFRRHEGDVFSLSEGGVALSLQLDVRVILSKLPLPLRQNLLVEDLNFSVVASARREFDSIARRFGSVWPLVFGKWGDFKTKGLVSLHLDLLLRAVGSEDSGWRVPRQAEMAKWKEEAKALEAWKKAEGGWSVEPAERPKSIEMVVLGEMARSVCGELGRRDATGLLLEPNRPDGEVDGREAISTSLACFVAYLRAWLDDPDLCTLAKHGLRDEIGLLHQGTGRGLELLRKMESLLDSPSAAAKR